MNFSNFIKNMLNVKKYKIYEVNYKSILPNIMCATHANFTSIYKSITLIYNFTRTKCISKKKEIPRKTKKYVIKLPQKF